MGTQYAQENVDTEDFEGEEFEVDVIHAGDDCEAWIDWTSCCARWFVET